MYPLQPLPVKVIVVRLAGGVDSCRRHFRGYRHGFGWRFGRGGRWRPDCPADDQQQQDAAEFQDEGRRDTESLPHAANLEAEKFSDGRHLERCIGCLVDTGVVIQLFQQLLAPPALVLPLHCRRALNIKASDRSAERPARRLRHVRAGLRR